MEVWRGKFLRNIHYIILFYYKGIIQLSLKKLKTWGKFYSPACVNHSCFSSNESDVTRRTDSLN